MDPMDLASLGRLISERRHAQGLMLADLAHAAGVGRSTLAALESGKLPELGFCKVARICAAAGILLETRLPLLSCPPLLSRPPRSGFTKEVLRDLIVRGDHGTWRELLYALGKDDRGLLAARIRSVVGTLDRSEPNVEAFTELLPGIMRRAIARARARG